MTERQSFETDAELATGSWVSIAFLLRWLCGFVMLIGAYFVVGSFFVQAASTSMLVPDKVEQAVVNLARWTCRFWGWLAVVGGAMGLGLLSIVSRRNLAARG